MYQTIKNNLEWVLQNMKLTGHDSQVIFINDKGMISNDGFSVFLCRDSDTGTKAVEIMNRIESWKEQNNS